MMGTSAHRWWRVVTLALCGVMAATGCRSTTSPERHIRPTGVIVSAGDDELAIARTGQPTEGSIEVPAGGETAVLTFTFIDAQGNPISPPEDYHLDLRFADASRATFVAQGAPTSFQGRIQGTAAGSTTVQARLMHGPPGHPAAHADYTSPGIPVVVE